MTQTTIQNGSRQVVITRSEGWSRYDTSKQVWFHARLYVNGGETAGHQHWSGKTEAGAKRWAERTLANH